MFERGLLHVDTICKAFTDRGFGFTYFPTAAEAVAYLTDACRGKSVSLGGSMTLKELGFPEAFQYGTSVHWHWVRKGEYFQKPDIYLSSANALSESGEIVNIDGTATASPRRCSAPSAASLSAASTSCARIWRARSSASAMSRRRSTPSVWV